MSIRSTSIGRRATSSFETEVHAPATDRPRPTPELLYPHPRTPYPRPPDAVSDFALSAAPTSQSVTRGGSVTYSISVAPSNGFAGPVALSVTGAPSASSTSFASSSLDTSLSTTTSLRVGTTSSTPTGTFSLLVKGVSGSINHTATLTLQVRKQAGKKKPLTQTVTGSPTLLESSTLSVTVTTTDRFRAGRPPGPRTRAGGWPV